jgi:hypothetical protein
MIPLRDTAKSKRFPVVNTTLIAVNCLVFVGEIAQGPQLKEFVYTYGLVPADVMGGRPFSPVSLLTFMFIHGGFWHLLANMWSLYIFGDNVEDRMGRGRYLLFYLLIGLASGIAHALVNPASQVPTIGASGAIAGIMGAYVLLYPQARILTLVPVFFFFYFIEVPAFVFVGVWFLFQFMSAAGAGAQKAGIAWWAHIAGFIFGLLLVKVFAKSRSRQHAFR